MRVIHVAAAQMGPIQKADSREAVVKRMIALMDEAKAGGADLIIYPELALTTFFPRCYMQNQAEVDGWCEREMPNAETQPLFERAVQYQMAMSFGYAELTPDGHHFKHLHRPTGSCDGTRSNLRGRLPRVLLRIPAGARPARCAGRPPRRHSQEASELGA
jgi:hypothetical protein